MKRLLLAILVVFLLAVKASYAVTYFELENATMRYNLSYDNQSFSYADNSLANDKCWIKLCGSELIGKSMLVYTGGNTSQFKQIDNLGRAIALDGGECFNFSADVSSLRAIYPGRVGVITGADYSFATTDTVHWTNEYALGNFTIVRSESATDVTVRVFNITNNTQHEIADNQTMLVVTLIRDDTSAVLDSTITAKNVSVDLSKQLYEGDTTVLVNGMVALVSIKTYDRASLEALSFADIFKRLPSYLKYQYNQLVFSFLQTKMGWLYRNFANIFAVDAILSYFPVRFSYLADSIALLPVQLKLLDLSRLYSDILNLFDIYSRFKIFSPIGFEGSLLFSDVFQRMIGLTRQSSTSLLFIDLSPKIFTKMILLPDSISIAGLFSKLYGFSRLFSNSIVFLMVQTRVVNLSRYFIDIFSIQSAMVRLASFQEQIAGIFSFSSVMLRLTDMTRQMTDVVMLVDVLSGISARITGISEMFTIASVQSRMIDLTRPFVDAFIFISLLSRYMSFQTQIAESITLYDISARLIGLFKSFSDMLSLSDLSIRVVDLMRPFTDMMSFADASSMLLNVTRGFADRLTLTYMTLVIKIGIIFGGAGPGGGPEVELLRYVKPEITYACTSDQECVAILNNNNAKCIRQFCYIREYVEPPWRYANQGLIVVLVLFTVFIIYDRKEYIRKYFVKEGVLEDKEKKFYRAEERKIERRKEAKEFTADVGGRKFEVKRRKAKPVERVKRRKTKTKKYKVTLA